MKHFSKIIISIFTVVFVYNNNINAQSFTAGNIVVLQVGDGSAALSSASTALFLKEYSTSGTLTNSVAIPTTGPTALTSSGSASSEGLITLSTDNAFIVIPGYNAAVGLAGVATSSTATVPRAIGTVSANGTYSLPVTTTSFSGNNARGAVSDGTNYWGSGAANGIILESSGAGTNVSSTFTNTRAVEIFNGQLYSSASAGSLKGIATVGTGTPTTTGNTSTQIINTTLSPYQFSINPGGTIAYIADDGVGIQKWTKFAGVWSLTYVLNSTKCRGLIVDYSGADPSTGVGAKVYATDAVVAASNTIFRVVDAGGTTTSSTVIATAPANTAFRGIAFSPIVLCVAPAITTLTNDSPVCSGSDIHFTSAASGSTPLAYSWAGPFFTSVSQNPSIIAATPASNGVYTLTVTNACGTATMTTVAGVSSPTAVPSQTNVSCFGGNNGTATVNVSGGIPSYTYSWSPSGGTAATASGLTSGTYTCTFTDFIGCTGSKSFTITQPSTAITSSVSSQTNISCNGGSNGAATISASGGTPGYTYSWSPSPGAGQGTVSVTGLTAQNYTCTITDVNSCTQQQTVNITAPTAITSSVVSQTNILCNGGSNGAATISASGGTPGYTYSWSPSPGAGQGTVTITGLTAQLYTCTITDANGCTKTQTVNITAPTAITSSVSSQTNISCNGGSNGAATISASGGTPGYTYSWSPSGGTGATATGLTAQLYTCTITDANTCSHQQTVNITTPTAITASIASSTNISCHGGNDGSATVNASGGTGAFTYSWAPSGGTAATASSLIAGTYTCTITDANLCTSTATVTLTEPASNITVTQTQTNVSCNGGNNGTANLTVSGGNPFGGTSKGLIISEFLANPPGSDSPFEFVEMVATKNIDFSVTPYTVIWCNNGTATASGWISGGALSYAFSITTGTVTPGQIVYVGGSSMSTFGPSSNILRSINTGTTNGDGGMGTANSGGVMGNGGTNADGIGVFNLPLASITNSTVPVDAVFYGTAIGTALVSAGTQGYQLPVNDLYPGGKIQSTSFFGPDPGSGAYIFATGSYNVQTNTFPTTRTWGTSLTFTNTSSVNLIGLYNYSWSNLSTAQNLTGLTAGTYTFTVTDNSPCPFNGSVTITEPPVLAATISAQTNITCNGANNGSLTVNATGGTGAYTYAWTPSGGTAATASSLSAATYTCTITDANGCTTTASATITEPAVLAATISAQTNISCNGGNNGSLTVDVTGGTTAYAYMWTPSGGTAATASLLTAGSYTCTITDSHACTTTASATITEPVVLAATISAQTNISCNGGNNGSATVNVTGGTTAYTYSWAPSGGTNAIATSLTAGTYTCTITDANLCTTTASVLITEPSILVATISAQTNISCNGGNNGSATVNVTGGTTGYTYAWTPSGGTNAIATSLTAGTYTCTITDANLCTTTASVLITEPSVLAATISAQTNISCNGGNNGSLTVSVTGGTSGYTFAWTPSGGTAATATLLGPGTYTCTVTDANTCTATASATITQPTPLVVTISSQTNNLCSGASNGSANANVSGGTPSYDYAWTPSGQTSALASSLVSGTYTCTVTDANTCTASATVAITEPTPVTGTISAVNTSCGNNNGSATVTASGGNGSYTYNWTPAGGSLSTAINLASGIYTCTITDALGCSGTATVSIGSSSSPSVTVTSQTNPTCNGGSDGSATVDATGGTGSYSYNWLPSGGTASTATGLAAGNYTCTITDASTCTASVTVSIVDPAPIVFSVGSDTTVCSPFTVNFCAPGGFTSYTWSNLSTTSCITAGTSGCYTVTVTDANGCVGMDTVCLTVNICTGITEVTSTGFNLYPNPNDGHFTVILGNNKAESKFELFDAQGQLLDQRMIQQNSTIDLSQYAKGFYFVRIDGETQKLIIR